MIELYDGQQLGLERIGQIYGVSRHTVTHLAHRYGVALRQPSRPYRCENGSRGISGAALRQCIEFHQ